MRILENPEFAPVFSTDARAEVAIVADLPEFGPHARVTGRLDRVAVSANSVLAVDFKTNRQAPQRLEDVPHLYVTQMALYRAAIAKVFPGRRIACALVWTESASLMPIAPERLDAEIADIRARLDPQGHHS
jgi:ATP-dependent helicase/nuclease subunit A